MHRNEGEIIIKCSGGATAQLLALSNAIYLSTKLKSPFKIKYYPYSTVACWPLALKELLEERERELIEEGKTRGIKTTGLRGGEHISDFPLRRKNFSYERLLQVIHKLHLINSLNYLRGKVVIGGRRRNLKKVSKTTSVVSDNFVPLVDQDVFAKLSDRISKANFPNPFSISTKKSSIVIHYRLGDMRKMPSRDPKLGDHGVVDLKTFEKILQLENIDFTNTPIDLVSDEPHVVSRVLEGVGIKTNPVSGEKSIWVDLKTIASADIFIGSLSKFSFFSRAICAFKGGKCYLPSKVYGQSNLVEDLGIDLFNYYDYKYLQPNHFYSKIFRF